MEGNRMIVRWVGVLFLVQMATAVISYSVILEPLLFKTNYLELLYENSNIVRVAMFLDLVCGLSVFGIAVLLFPVLKNYNERIAFWYVGQRLTELVGFIISGILLLALVRLASRMGTVPESELPALNQIAYYIRNIRGNIQNVALFIYCFGAWSFYGLLFYYRLIPRFIALWGLIAVALLCVEITANIFGTSVGGLAIMMPLGINELFLGFWLIFKGLKTPQIPS